MGCFSPILFLAALVLVLVSLIRWFEQTTEAVDQRDWGRLLALLVMPFSVWLFRSNVTAGRPTAFPKHEPVRGFGSIGKSRGPSLSIAPQPPAVEQSPSLSSSSSSTAPLSQPDDQPPPGTPPEFLGMPKIPPPRARPKSSVDPALVEKLKKKMRDQGMLPPE